MTWARIDQILRTHTRFVITTHVNPDGDGIGAACALAELLRSLNKHARFVCDSPIPDRFAFLDTHRIFEEYHDDLDFSNVEVLIVLDTHRRERIGRMAVLIDNPDITVVCIDHHEVTKTFTEYTIIDPSACSVGAMLCDLYKELEIPLTLPAATGIYASVLCDTSRFSNSSTNAQAYDVARTCVEAGVNPSQMCGRLFQTVPLSQIQMVAQSMRRMEMYFSDRVAMQILRQQDSLEIDPELGHIDLDYVHDFTKMIDGLECAVLLREVAANEVRISLRSKNNIDVGHVVRQIGGGGHSKAAGATYQGTVEEARDRLIELFSGVFAEV
jgi:phosphoesterase RecJ-like protein